MQRSQHLTQADPRVFGAAYVAQRSSVNGQAAFLDEDPDHRHIDYFQGLERFHEQGLPLKLPVAQREGGEDDDEIASVRSVDSMGSTATGSSATLIGEAPAAANEFVSLLLEDQTLTPLLLTAFDRIKADKLERNFKRLLKVYAIDLRQEATGDIEKEAVQLILMRARYIAYRIRQRYDKSAPDNAGRFQRSMMYSMPPNRKPPPL